MKEPSFNAEPESWVDYAEFLGVEVDPTGRRDAIRAVVLASPEHNGAEPDEITDAEMSEDEQIEALLAAEAVDAVDVDPTGDDA